MTVYGYRSGLHPSGDSCDPRAIQPPLRILTPHTWGRDYLHVVHGCGIGRAVIKGLSTGLAFPNSPLEYTTTARDRLPIRHIPTLRQREIIVAYCIPSLAPTIALEILTDIEQSGMLRTARARNTIDGYWADTG